MADGEHAYDACILVPIYAVLLSFFPLSPFVARTVYSSKASEGGSEFVHIQPCSRCFCCVLLALCHRLERPSLHAASCKLLLGQLTRVVCVRVWLPATRRQRPTLRRARSTTLALCRDGRLSVECL